MICRKIYQGKLRNSVRHSICRWFQSSVSPVMPATVCSGKRIHFFRNYTTAFTSFSKTNASFTLRGCNFSTQDALDLPAGGIIDIPLAQTGEGIAECELLKWFVQEGEQVEEFQPLCEVQSDKATIEITSRYKGKVSQILHVPGSIVKVGETLLKIGVDEIPDPTETSDFSEKMTLLESDFSGSSDISSVPEKTKIGGVSSTPAVRNIAKQYGLDINDVPATGKDGRILKEDVINYAMQKGLINEAPACAQQKHSEISPLIGGRYEDRTLQLRGYQRAMVKSMTLAAKIPHFYYVEEMNCDALVELKKSFQNEDSDPKIKYTFLPVLVKSLSMALTAHPMLNSRFNEESYEVILKGSHNIGIAMATPNGLVVPNIKNVQSLSILEITKELSRLQNIAKINKLSPNDISGGTITLSNIGGIGGKFGSPLINSPEVAIIGMGRIQKIPRFAEDGNVYPASVMTINVGADHRVLDGATVARFCNDWKKFVEKPDLLLLHTR
ncbi:Bce2p [Datura stramonium]|uniref:Dihydrolipoamide acetyltransferase component of pyruvate dehydrogenase complex n=1 Tax=Datura stramonium TaxID=4076 RepID=A0ABS8UKJ3_DATST|nr:Bce2p [Datura stramonium]